MKKLSISLAGILAAIVFSPEASAIPAFARQVGMACSACHYQHFPVLNSFGRAFKQGGYTMVGAQEKIEAEGFSLPTVLNAALVGYAQYQRTNGPSVNTPTTKSTNDGQIQIPQQVSLFLGGRAAEHVGYEAEVSISGAGVDTGSSTGTGLIRLKIPFVYEVGGVKAGVVPFGTSGLGVADSFEILNTGAVGVHAFNQTSALGTTMGGMQVISAQQYINTGTAASGAAFVASNEQFFANFAKWGADTGLGSSGTPNSNYLRAAWTPGDLIPGFDSAVGMQLWSGTSVSAAGAAATTWVNGAGACTGGFTVVSAPWGTCTTNAGANGVFNTKASSIDAQLMGDVRGMPLLVVASYAKTPAQGNDVNPNLFNPGAVERKSLNIGAELGIIPNKATLQFGIRRASSGAYIPSTVAAGVVSGTAGNATDNAIMFGGTYNIALNVRAELTITKASGDMYNSIAAKGNGYLGDTLTTLDLAFGF